MSSILQKGFNKETHQIRAVTHHYHRKFYVLVQQSNLIGRPTNAGMQLLSTSSFCCIIWIYFSPRNCNHMVFVPDAVAVVFVVKSTSTCSCCFAVVNFYAVITRLQLFDPSLIYRLNYYISYFTVEEYCFDDGLCLFKPLQSVIQLAFKSVL